MNLTLGQGNLRTDKIIRNFLCTISIHENHRCIVRNGEKSFWYNSFLSIYRSKCYVHCLGIVVNNLKGHMHNTLFTIALVKFMVLFTKLESLLVHVVLTYGEYFMREPSHTYNNSKSVEIFSWKLKEIFTKYYCIDIRVVFTSFKVKHLVFTEVLYFRAFVSQCSL